MVLFHRVSQGPRLLPNSNTIISEISAFSYLNEIECGERLLLASLFHFDCGISHIHKSFRLQRTSIPFIKSDICFYLNYIIIDIDKWNLIFKVVSIIYSKLKEVHLNLLNGFYIFVCCHWNSIELTRCISVVWSIPSTYNWGFFIEMLINAFIK